jgi:peptidoglycan-N-acetylglucosamine deacetylase
MPNDYFSRSVSLLAAVLAAGLAGPPAARAAKPAAKLGTVRQQVHRAKAELQHQVTLGDYHASAYHPTAIVERIHALESADAWSELCAAFEDLPDDELELFEDEIHKPDHASRMACAPALLRRIDAYWRAESGRLAQAHPLSAAPALLESIAIPVDLSRDGVYTDGQLAEGQIAITFDDGPHATRTARVLEILRGAGVRADFFEIGRNAAAHPEIARQVVAAGHIVGSHTFSHADLGKLPEKHAETEIESGEASVSLALGRPVADVPFFRFPYGAKTASELVFVQKRGNTTFFWNMDSEDWKIRNPHQLFLNVLQQLDRARRGIILFHDIHEQTVIVLPHLLQELRVRGFKTVVFVPQGSVKSRD